jgi:hypothetical protein
MKSCRFYYAFALLFTVNLISAKAQVKITDGAVMTLDQNSLLELESTNKGLLITRIAINDASQTAPLTAPVPTGMLIYSSGGTIPDGFYYWNGTVWKVLPSGLVSIANGGTNSGTALSGSSIIISNGSSIVQGPAGTATTVLHGNAAGAPAYGAVGLTTDVTGVLPVANGGTALSTLGAANQVLTVNSTQTGYTHRTMKFQVGTWGTANLLAAQTNLSLFIVAVGGGNLGAAGSIMNPLMLSKLASGILRILRNSKRSVTGRYNFSSLIMELNSAPPMPGTLM